MKTLQKSLSSTQLLTSFSSTLKKSEKKRFPIDTEDPQYLVKSHFFYGAVDAFIYSNA